MDKSSLDIKKTITDFTSFANYFLKIRTKENSIDKLILNKEQKFIYKQIKEQNKKQGKVRILILKGRQIGSTTFCSAYNLHSMFINKAFKSMVLAHRQNATNNIYDMIFRYIKLSPKILQPKMLLNMNKSISFIHNDSSIVFATAGGKEVGRSSTINFFHGSEVAFWSNANNHISSILMAVPDSKKSTIILESTSAGSSGVFYEMCMDAYKNNSMFKLIFIPWYWHKEYKSNSNINLSNGWLKYGKENKLSKKQLMWAYEKNSILDTVTNLENGPTMRFMQEFPTTVHEAFLSSEKNVLISNYTVNKNAISKKDLNTSDINDYFIQDMQGKSRILGVDVATTGADKTCIIDKVGNFMGFNINEQYHNISTMEIAGILVNHIKTFIPDKICIDAMGGGIGIYDRLVELGYKDKLVLIYFGQKAENSIKYLNKRSEMWDKLRQFLENERTYIIKNDQLLSQVSSVQYFFNSNGQIQLEAKDNIKKRLGGSCDMADAAVLTFATEDTEKKNKYFINYKESKNTSYDPFTW